MDRMVTFHVYVEGPEDRTPGSVQRLADAIARTFGLPGPELATRLMAGRVRVKTNVDRAAAETVAKALREVGARVTIEEAQPAQPPTTAARGSAPALPPVTPARPSVPGTPSASAPSAVRPPASAPAPGAARPPASALPPSTAARPNASPLPPATASRATPQPFASGLSAAFSQEASPATDLGALGGDALALASLDGNDDEPAPAAPTPSPGLPASMGPAIAPAAGAAPARASTAPPIDLFAPPDADEAAASVELAVDDRPRARAPEPPPVAAGGDAAGPSAPAQRRSAPILHVGGTAAAPLPRARFAAGVLLAIVLGFIPAHLVAVAREHSAYEKIDAQVRATQQAASTPELYAQLDAFRDAQLDRKERAQRSIALTSLLIWAVAAAGLGYVWFRRVPWDKLGARPS